MRTRKQLAARPCPRQSKGAVCNGRALALSTLCSRNRSFLPSSQAPPKWMPCSADFMSFSRFITPTCIVTQKRYLGSVDGRQRQGKLQIVLCCKEGSLLQAGSTPRPAQGKVERAPSRQGQADWHHAGFGRASMQPDRQHCHTMQQRALPEPTLIPSSSSGCCSSGPSARLGSPRPTAARVHTCRRLAPAGRKPAGPAPGMAPAPALRCARCAGCGRRSAARAGAAEGRQAGTVCTRSRRAAAGADKGVCRTPALLPACCRPACSERGSGQPACAPTFMPGRQLALVRILAELYVLTCRLAAWARAGILRGNSLHPGAGKSGMRPAGHGGGKAGQAVQGGWAAGPTGPGQGG